MKATDSTSADGRADSLQLSLSRIVRLHKGKALLAFACGILVTMTCFAFATRYYQSEAKLFVKMGRQSVSLDPTATTGQSISVREIQNQEVFAVEELMNSRTIAEKVVDHFGPEVILEGGSAGDTQGESETASSSKLLAKLDAYNLNPLRVYNLRDKAVKAFGQNLKVLAGKKTNILSVSYESKDPLHSQEVLQALIKYGLEEHLQMHRIRGSEEFFIEQSELQRKTLETLEQKLRDLKSTTGLASLETQRNLHLGLLGGLRQDLLSVQAEYAALQSELAERRKQQESIPSMIVLERTSDQPQTISQEVREKIYDLELEEQELAARYTNSHPKLVQVRNKIAESRSIAEQVGNRPSIKTGLNPNYQAAQLAVMEREGRAIALKSRIEAINQEISSAEAKLIEINKAEVDITELEREIELANANYRTYSENLEQARINNEIYESKISSLNVMQQPTYVETPASPKPSVTLGVGGILSVLLGAIVAIHSEKKLLQKQLQTQATPDTTKSPNLTPASRPKPRLDQRELVLKAEKSAS